MKTKMKKIKAVILCSLLIIFTAASYALCAEESNSPGQTLPSPVGVVQPQVSQAPDRGYSYNPLGKPDPFKPFIDVEIKVAKKEKETKAESIFPLQRAGVESFKLVGIVGDQIRRVAVVEDLDKRFYPIFIGTRIGLHNGKVTDILADRITVDELDGKKVKRIILKLRKNI